MSEDLIKKLAKLHEEHSDLPVVTMVDTEVVPSDDYGFWKGNIRNVVIRKYITSRNGEILFYDDKEYENVWDIYDYRYVRDKMPLDVTEEEAEKILAKLYEKAPWIEAIIIWVGVGND